jgi:hypothetical protein
LIRTNVPKNQAEKIAIFEAQKISFQEAVINKKNIYQQIDFRAFAIFKINTFVREI